MCVAYTYTGRCRLAKRKGILWWPDTGEGTMSVTIFSQLVVFVPSFWLQIRRNNSRPCYGKQGTYSIDFWSYVGFIRTRKYYIISHICSILHLHLLKKEKRDRRRNCYFSTDFKHLKRDDSQFHQKILILQLKVFQYLHRDILQFPSIRTHTEYSSKHWSESTPPVSTNYK